MSYSAFAYANPGFWIANDLKLFQEVQSGAGIDLGLGSKIDSSHAGGSLDAAQVGGAATVSAAAQGAEVVILGTIFTRLNFAVHVSSQIKEIGDLKGKPIVTGSIGGNTYFALFCSCAISAGLRTAT